MFSKVEYKKNREAGVRGQGIMPHPEPLSQEDSEKSYKEGSHYVQVSGKLVRVNRAISRRRFINHQSKSKTARLKTPEVSAAIIGRVLRKELGEKERIAKKTAQKA